MSLSPYRSWDTDPRINLYGRWMHYQTWDGAMTEARRQYERYVYMATALGLGPNELYALSQHGAFKDIESYEQGLLDEMLVMQMEYGGYEGGHEPGDGGVDGLYSRQGKEVAWDYYGDVFKIDISYLTRVVRYEWHKGYRYYCNHVAITAEAFIMRLTIDME